MFCSNCGELLNDADSFCPACGQRQQTDGKTIGSADYVKVLPDGAVRYNASQAVYKKKQYRRPVSFRIAACILLIAMTISAVIKLRHQGEEVSIVKVEETEKATVSASSSTSTLAGIRVEANPLNLLDGEKTLFIKRYKQNRDMETGMDYIEYDISLGDMHQLKAPLKVTLPYSKVTADSGGMALLHYNSDYRMWIPMASEIDESEGNVSAKLTSLSPVRLVYLGKEYPNSVYYVRNLGHSNATIEVNYNFWNIIKSFPTLPAAIVASDYIATGNTAQSSSWLNSQQASEAINQINTYYTLFGALGDTAMSVAGTIGEAGSAITNATSQVSKGIGIVSLAIAVAQLSHDLYYKGEEDPETAINLYKNMATNTGTLISLFSGFSSVALSAGFLAVAATGYGLDLMVETAKEIQANTTETIFNTYYSELGGSFNETEWYMIFVDAYYDAWQDGTAPKDGLKRATDSVIAELDGHAESFWKTIYKDGNDALTFAVAESGVKNYYKPTEKHKAELTAKFKQDLYKRFNAKVIPWINEFMQTKLQDGIYAGLLAIAKPYNNYYTVQIQEIVPEGSQSECVYQMCPIRFGSEEGFIRTDYPREWELLAPEDDRQWAVKHDFTLLGYMMAGAPNKVFLFDAWDEKKNFGDQIETKELTLAGEEAGYLTLINLLPAKSSELINGIYVGEDFDGGYNGTLTPAFRIVNTKSGIYAGACNSETGDYDKEWQAECVYNAKTLRYEGRVRGKESKEDQEMVIFVTPKGDKDNPRAYVKMQIIYDGDDEITPFEGDIIWKGPLVGDSIDDEVSEPAPETDLPPGYGKPVGGFGP